MRCEITHLVLPNNPKRLRIFGAFLLNVLEGDLMNKKMFLILSLFVIQADAYMRRTAVASFILGIVAVGGIQRLIASIEEGMHKEFEAYLQDMQMREDSRKRTDTQKMFGPDMVWTPRDEKARDAENTKRVS